MPEELGHLHFDKLELSPSQQRLAREINNQLLSKDAISIVYDPSKGRTGSARFIVVDSPDSSLHIALTAHTQGGGKNPFGFPRYDYVKLLWLDGQSLVWGRVEFIDRPDENAYKSAVSTTPNPYMANFWRETGGIDSGPGYLGAPPVSDEQLTRLAEALSHSKINQQFTAAAMEYLAQKFGATRFIDTAQEPKA